MIDSTAVFAGSPTRRRRGAELWKTHVRPALGDRALRSLEPAALDAFKSRLDRDGLDPAAIQEALSLVRALAEFNGPEHAAGTALPLSGRHAAVQPLEPIEVERLRARVGDRDATLISLLAYAGLRPSELAELRWGDVRAETLMVDARDLAVRPHTSPGGVRWVTLSPPIAADLAAWRSRSAGTGDQLLVFCELLGRAWTEETWQAWRREVFVPAVKAAGLPAETRPYDLRHTFVWLLLREGASLLDVAHETGYAPRTALDMFRHLADRASGMAPRFAAEAIAAARASVKPSSPAAEA